MHGDMGAVGRGLLRCIISRPGLARCSLFLPNDMVRMPCAAQCSVVGDHALAVKIVKAIVHEGHAFFAPGLNGVLQLVNIVLADQIANGTIRNNQLVSEHPPGAVRGGK